MTDDVESLRLLREAEALRRNLMDVVGRCAGRGQALDFSICLGLQRSIQARILFRPIWGMDMEMSFKIEGKNHTEALDMLKTKMEDAVRGFVRFGEIS